MKKILIFVLTAIIVWLMLDFFPNTIGVTLFVIFWSVFYTAISTLYLFVPKREVRDTRNISIAWGGLILFLLVLLWFQGVLANKNLLMLTSLLFVWFFIANRVVGEEMLQEDKTKSKKAV